MTDATTLHNRIVRLKVAAFRCRASNRQWRAMQYNAAAAILTKRLNALHAERARLGVTLMETRDYLRDRKT